MCDRLEEFNSKTTHLYWVGTAKRCDWESLVDKVADGITVDGLRSAISPVGTKIMALKNNIQEPIETAIVTVESDENDTEYDIDLQSDLGSAIAYQQIENTEISTDSQSSDRAEIEKLQDEMAALKANGYNKMAEAESQMPVKPQPSPKKSSSSKALHSSSSQEFYTPLEIIRDIDYVFGGVTDLDPATCELALRDAPALQYFTKETNGLEQIWNCQNFRLNAPGGLENQELRTDPETGEVKLHQSGDSNQKLFFLKAEAEYLDGNAKQGIVIAFNDALRAMCPSVHKYPICWVGADATADCVTGGGRIRFDSVDENGDRVPQNSPTHSNFFVFLPPNFEVGATELENREKAPEIRAAIARFEETFKKYGTVTVPEKWRNL
jgi:hypothetical protein